MTEHPNSTLARRLREYADWADYLNLKKLLIEAADEIDRRPPATEEGGVLPHQNAEDHGCSEDTSDEQHRSEYFEAFKDGHHAGMESAIRLITEDLARIKAEHAELAHEAAVDARANTKP